MIRVREVKEGTERIMGELTKGMQLHLPQSGSPGPLCPSTLDFVDSVRPKSTHCLALGDSLHLSGLGPHLGHMKEFFYWVRFRDRNAYPGYWAGVPGRWALGPQGRGCGYVV